MNRFITKADLLEILCISKETYRKVTDPTDDQYDPDFPKPVKAFTSNKLRFSSIDVDHYIAIKSHSTAA